MVSDFFQRLDAVTDYKTLVTSLYGQCRDDGAGELWLVSPIDGNTRADQFSISAIDGRWQNHKDGEGGSFIDLLKQTHTGTWKDEWAKAIPLAADILFPDKPGSDKSGSSPRKKTFAERAAVGFKRQDPNDLKPFAEAYGVSVDHLLELGCFTQKGGRLGATPRLLFPIVNPKDGSVTGLKMRALTACIPTKGGKKLKSKNQAGTKAGLIGFKSGSDLPVLVLEGEKDQVVGSFDFPEFHVLTNSNGASAWKPEWTEALADRDVTLLYDDDDAGNRGARKAAQQVFSKARSVRIAHIGSVDKDVFNILRDEDGGGKEALLAIIEAGEVYDPGENLGEIDSFIRTNCMADDLEPGDIAATLFGMLLDHGAMFLQVDEHEGFCAWRGRVYEVGASNPWWSMLVYEYTGCDARGTQGFRIHNQLLHLSITRGMAVAPTTWFGKRDDCLYLPLHGQEQKLVEIGPQGIRVVPNGHKDVVLMPTSHAKEIEYLDDSHYDPVKGAEAWRRMFALMNCTEEWRAFVSAVVLALPFFDWCETHPLLRFQGPTGSGKSFASKIITTFLYGQPENQGGDTQAALYRMAGSRMLLSLDNLEDTNLFRQPELKDLMLRAASGTTRQKSARESERAVVAQRVTCWIVSTGKSPIGVGHEDMEERLVVIPTGGNQQSGFHGTGVLKWVEENRVLLWGYYLRQVQTIHQRLSAGSHLSILAALPNTHRPRLQEWYSVVGVSAGDSDRPSTRTLGWISDAHEGERESVIESDPLVSLLNRMPSFFQDDFASKPFRDLKYTNNGAVFETIIHGQVLHAIFSQIARQFGLFYGTRSAKGLGYRLRSLKRRSADFGIDIEQRSTQTRVPGTGQRGKAWFLRIHLDTINVIADEPQQTIERYVGMDSGGEIEITPEEREQAHEESESDRGDPGWPGEGD